MLNTKVQYHVILENVRTLQQIPEELHQPELYFSPSCDYLMDFPLKLALCPLCSRRMEKSHSRAAARASTESCSMSAGFEL